MVILLTKRETNVRKEQRCRGCGRTFPSGTKMLKETLSKNGKSVYGAHICQTCNRIICEERNYKHNYAEGELYERAIEIEAELALEEKE